MHSVGDLNWFLSYNSISGPLPPEIFSSSLASLFYLTLENNELTGQIPSNYGQLPSLLSLYLNDNKLSGTLPASLGKNLAQVFF